MAVGIVLRNVVKIVSSGSGRDEKRSELQRGGLSITKVQGSSMWLTDTFGKHCKPILEHPANLPSLMSRALTSANFVLAETLVPTCTYYHFYLQHA